MKKFLLGAVIVTGVATMLTGCVVTKPFEPKPLDEKARGISIVRSTPYGCKVLGEVEGFDKTNSDKNRPFDVIYTDPTLEEARRGALNDARNNAVEVAGKAKRVTLRIVEAKATCFTPNGVCAPNIIDTSRVLSFRVSAQVFECGKKD
ncbi:hypothetical protein [Rodentibacter haemolyticus]|uniref:DUF4156 domain-containing protein n=1 Tax=Rodentibacter haemolyticus TaxID=2778911 RepID=A0ABX6UUV7_9PAST|nr:hypothetical protein [Rodentibacter haemolyticus]QPB41807.1 hypothetical protein IHV77_07650 [Rodentibacter haemolyticus]